MKHNRAPYATLFILGVLTGTSCVSNLFSTGYYTHWHEKHGKCHTLHVKIRLQNSCVKGLILTEVYERFAVFNKTLF